MTSNAAYQTLCTAITDRSCSMTVREHLLRGATELLRTENVDHIEALNGALKTRDIGLIETVFQIRGQGVDWNRHFNRGNIAHNIGTFAHEMNTDLLDLLFRNGIYISNNLHILLTRAHNTDRGDLLDWLDTHEAWGKPAWPVKSIYTRLMRCGPGRAAHLRKTIDFHIHAWPDKDSAAFLNAMIRARSGSLFLKGVAALLSSNARITTFMTPFMHKIPEPVSRLIEMTASMHGLVDLARLEPDRIGLLARPESDKFYRLEQRDMMLPPT